MTSGNTMIYPGTFDPLTKGHLDIIERAARLCDRLYVCVMYNPAKQTVFTPEERAGMAKRCVEAAGIDNVMIDSYPGLLVDYMKQHEARAVVRGLRSESDLRYEQEMATANRILYDQYEVVFLASRPELSYTSSSIVREVASLGGDISGMVPEAIQAEVEARFKEDSYAQQQ